MQVPIDRIKVKRRVRKDAGDIDALAASMSAHGLLHPSSWDVETNSCRRPTPCCREETGMEYHHAVVVDIPDKAGKLELELEENVQRAALSYVELEEGYAVWNGCAVPIYSTDMGGDTVPFPPDLPSGLRERGIPPRP